MMLGYFFNADLFAGLVLVKLCQRSENFGITTVFPVFNSETLVLDFSVFPEFSVIEISKSLFIGRPSPLPLTSTCSHLWPKTGFC